MSTAAAARPAATPREPGWPPLWLCGVHLTALWTLAFVQPLFDLLGKNAAFFVARENTGGDVLILALVWTFAPPLAATALVALARLASRRAGQVAQLAFVAALTGVLALQLVKGLSQHTPVVLPIALAIGVAAAVAYTRFAGLRTFVSLLGVAPVVILVLLLVVSPVRGIVFPGDEASAAANAAATNPAPVVLMVYDELPTASLMKPDSTIDARRYPSFARLAQSSTWYRNATSVSDATYVAVPAIFTGVRPQAELPTAHVYPRNVFSLLGKAYDQHVAEPVTSVCPESLCGAQRRDPRHERLASLVADLSIVERRILLPDDMASKLPPIDRDWEDFQADAGNDDLAQAATRKAAPDDIPTAPGSKPIRVAGDDVPSQRVREGRAVVQTMRPGGPKPGFWMVHYVIPHVPWRFEPDGSQYVVQGPAIPGLDDQDWGSDPFLLDQAYQRHVLMLRFGDRLLGEAIDQMQRSGLWDKALVIVVADHGGAIGPEESRRPVTTENFPQVGGVPLFVKQPGQQQGSVDERFVTTLDVVPTIASELGIDTSWKFDGLPVDQPHPAEELRQRNGRQAKLVGVSPQDFARRRDAEVAARARRFPPGLASIYEVGPRQDLVGKPLSALTLADPGGVGGFLNNADLYGEVKPGSGVTPAYVTGNYRGIDPGTDLVVAVNGRIEASGEAYTDHGDPRFSMLVPPRVLRPGANRVQVLAVQGDMARQIVRMP